MYGILTARLPCIMLLCVATSRYVPSWPGCAAVPAPSLPDRVVSENNLRCSACFSLTLQIIEHLLQAAADPQATDKAGKKPCDVASPGVAVSLQEQS